MNFQNKMHVVVRSIVLMLIFALGISIRVEAQFFFPSIETLKDSNVKTIKVYRQQLKYIGGPDKERKKMGEPDTTRALYEVYHLNEYGYPDSIFTYRNYYYTYDEGSIVGHKVVTKDGQVNQRGEITTLPNGERISRSWEYEKIRSKVRINADSILVDQYFYAFGDTVWSSRYQYDPETDLKTEEWRGKDGAYKIETYQWFTVDGKPSTFRHTLEEREAGKSKIITKEKTYPLDSAGNVVNRYLGRFDDPYIMYNYNRRFDKFTNARFNGQGRFREDYLVRTREHEQLWTFSGIQILVRYELEYEYR